MSKKTFLLKLTDSSREESIEQAAKALNDGKLVVFPTETVYGIGANALDEQAVEQIYVAKGRPGDNPLIVHVAEWEQIMPLVREIPPKAKLLADAFWPGPLTLVLPKSSVISDKVSGGLDSVAIRIPSHSVARELLQKAGIPVAAPSANRSGSPSPTTVQHCINDLDGRVDIILDGGSSTVGLESTVLSLLEDTPVLLRPGGITPEQLEEIVGPIKINPAVLKELETDEHALSPGMKYKHYAPTAEVLLVRGTAKAFADYCNQEYIDGLWSMAFAEDVLFLEVPTITYGHRDNPKEQGANLFSVLRELDDKGAKKIVVHAPSSEGVGLAVYNRLLRAANFHEIIL